MNFIKVPALVSLIIGMATLTCAFAGNGVDRGGGTSIILPDDTVILADPFLMRAGNEGTFHCDKGDRGDLAPAVVEVLRMAGSFLVRYGASATHSARDGFKLEALSMYEIPLFTLSSFIESEVLDPDVEYCFVSRLPQSNVMELDKTKISQSSESQAVGYTEGKVTWINKDLFKRMDLRTQALTLIHERLHAIAGNTPHGPIVDITNGLRVILEISALQQKGLAPLLDAQQVTSISQLTVQIKNLRMNVGQATQIESRSISEYRVVANGGGLVHRNVALSPTSYVGVGSIVGSTVSSIADHARVINSRFCSQEQGGVEPKIQVDSPQTPNPMFRMEAGAVLKNSSVLNCLQFVVIGQNSKVENSTLLMIDPSSFIKIGWKNSTHGGIWLDRGSSVENASLVFAGGLMLQPKSRIAGVQLDFDSVNAGAVQIELKSNSAVLNLKGMIRTFYSDGFFSVLLSKQDKAPRVIIESGAVLNFKDQFICESHTPMKNKRLAIVTPGAHLAKTVEEASDDICNY